MAEHHPTRRELLALGLGAFVVAAAPLAVRHRRVARRTVPMMGTVAELAVVHRDERWAHGALDAALAELRGVEAAMTRFSAASDVGRVNGAPIGSPVAVAPQTALVLAAALRWAERTDGDFDPALGRAAELWEAHGRSAPPPEAERRAWAGRRLYRSVGIDRWRGSDVVVRMDARVGLDLGGIAKGYGVDRAVTMLREWGIDSALVNVGGDLYALGASPEGDPWRIGVRSPERADTLATTLPVTDQAVATSGDYARFFEHGGRRWHHLLDPATGEPRRSVRRSLTVAAASCMEADAAGTAAFGLEPAAAQRRLAEAGSDARVLYVL